MTAQLLAPQALTVDDLDPADVLDGCGIGHRHAPHIVNAAVTYGCRGAAVRRMAPDLSGGTCGCSDRTCPCSFKPGHGGLYAAPDVTRRNYSTERD